MIGQEPNSYTRVGEVSDGDPKSDQQALEQGNTQDPEYLTSMPVGLRVEETLVWRLSLCNVYRLWQPDPLHLLHLDILKTMMDQLVGYLRQRRILD